MADVDYYSDAAVTTTTTTAAATRPVSRSSGSFYSRCGGILNIINVCLFVVLVAISARSIKYIYDTRDPANGNVAPLFKWTSLCFQIPDAIAWRYLIGIVAVSSTAIIHSVVVIVLGFMNRRGGDFKYACEFCIIPYAIVNLVLGCLIVAQMYLVGGHANHIICQDNQDYPYSISYATGAVAIAFSGFMIVMVPFFTFMTIWGENQAILAKAAPLPTVYTGTTYNNSSRRGGYVDDDDSDYSSYA